MQFLNFIRFQKTAEGIEMKLVTPILLNAVHFGLFDAYFEKIGLSNAYEEADFTRIFEYLCQDGVNPKDSFSLFLEYFHLPETVIAPCSEELSTLLAITSMDASHMESEDVAGLRYQFSCLEDVLLSIYASEIFIARYPHVTYGYFDMVHDHSPSYGHVILRNTLQEGRSGFIDALALLVNTRTDLTQYWSTYQKIKQKMQLTSKEDNKIVSLSHS